MLALRFRLRANCGLMSASDGRLKLGASGGSGAADATGAVVSAGCPCIPG
jgi:hypothetical protein